MRHSLVSSLSLAACAMLVAPTPSAAQDATIVASPQAAAQLATAASRDANDKLCSISGTVDAAKTGEPLRGASVSLTKEGGGLDRHPLGSRTDSEGRFTIQAIPAGQYEMEVARVGYVSTSYAQSQHSSSGAILTLTGNQKMTDLIFRLVKTATISGRLVDQNGDPIQQAEASASTRKMVHGKMQLEQRNSVTSDDRGEYRLWGLPPGRYVITVAPQNTEVGQEEYQTVYYPGTPDLARASVLELNSGDELTGMDFTLTPRAAEQTYKVRGHVTSAIEGGRPLLVAVMLFSRDNPNASFMQGRNTTAADPKTGDFAFEGVPPGEYVLTTMALVGETQHHASQIVTVTNSDVDHVSMVIHSGTSVVARVVMPGKAASDVMVRLEPMGDDRMFIEREHFPESQPDGSYLYRGLPDGAYSISVGSSCDDCYVASADVNGVDVLSHGLQIGGGTSPGRLDVVYRSDGATLSGTVTNKDELPAAGATVVLVPAVEPLRGPDAYNTAKTDQNGRFEIRGVAPGSYKAFAWEKADGDVYGDAESRKPYENSSESMDLKASEHKTVQLKIIPAADSN